MDKKKAKEYSELISDTTGVRSPRSSEEIALLYESGRHEELDFLDLSQYSSWLASLGNFDQAEHIAKLIPDVLIQQQTLTLVAERMIERGILERAKIILDLMRTEPTYNGRAQVNARVQLAEAYYKQGSAELATAILNEVEEFDKPESLTDFERADYLFVLANGWFTARQRERAKKFYIEAFEHAQRSFESTRAAGGNGFDEAKLSQAIIRRLTISGMLSEANKLTSLITDDFWREKAKTLIERSGS